MAHDIDEGVADDASEPQRRPLVSIGYGNQSFREFVGRLTKHNVRYVADVRSRPVSRQPEFNRRRLQMLLAESGIRYVYLGGELGGQPVIENGHDTRDRPGTVIRESIWR